MVDWSSDIGKTIRTTLEFVEFSKGTHCWSLLSLSRDGEHFPRCEILKSELYIILRSLCFESPVVHDIFFELPDV